MTIGHEALLVDLLAPGAATQSFRETSSPAALSRLTHFLVQSPCDIYEVIRKGRITRAMGICMCSCSESRATGSLEPGSVHTMLTLQLETRDHCRTGAKKGVPHIGRITFVELAAPEAKDIAETAVDGRDTRSLAIGFSTLTGVILGLGKSGSCSPRCTDMRYIAKQAVSPTENLLAVLRANFAMQIVFTHTLERQSFNPLATRDFGIVFFDLGGGHTVCTSRCMCGLLFLLLFNFACDKIPM